MAKKKKKSNIAALLLILCVLLLILVFLIGVLVYMVRSEGNGIETHPTPTGTVSQDQGHGGSQGESGKTKATETPTPSPEPTATSTPSPTPTPVVKYYSEAVDKVCELELGKVDSDRATLGVDSTVEIEVFDNDYYVSVLMHVKAGEKSYDKPMVFVKETGDVVHGSELFKETYFAILQEEVDVTTVYDPARYDAFYMDGTKVFFYLNGEIGKMGTYLEEDLTVAERFMKVNCKGEEIGYKVRTDLDPNKPMVALTFDDGPMPSVEARLIEAFQKYNACCTFFFVGNRFDAPGSSYEKSVQNLAEAGCEIASHTYSHTLFTVQSKIDAGASFDVANFWNEINKNNLLIAKVIGYAPDLLRTPGGNTNNYMDNLPMPRINWSVDTRDWADRPAKDGETKQQAYDRKVKSTYDEIMKSAKDGSIVLMHSLYDMSADGAIKAMEELSKQGYQFVTVSELAYYKGVTLESGKKYSQIHKTN